MAPKEISTVGSLFIIPIIWHKNTYKENNLWHVIQLGLSLHWELLLQETRPSACICLRLPNHAEMKESTGFWTVLISVCSDLN